MIHQEEDIERISVVGESAWDEPEIEREIRAFGKDRLELERAEVGVVSEPCWASLWGFR